jgi:hypothetical protein
MTRRTLSAWLTTLEGGVEACYQAEGQAGLAGQPGATAEGRASARVTVRRAHAFSADPGATACVGCRRAKDLPLFARRGAPSQVKRRARAVRFLVERWRQAWRLGGGGRARQHRVVAPQPSPGRGYKRSPAPRAVAGRATAGDGAARHRRYVGDQRVRLPPLEGRPLRADWLPAHRAERPAAAGRSPPVRACDRVGDPGVLAADWPAAILRQTGHPSWTSQRAKQALQNPLKARPGSGPCGHAWRALFSLSSTRAAPSSAGLPTPCRAVVPLSFST